MINIVKGGQIDYKRIGTCEVCKSVIEATDYDALDREILCPVCGRFEVTMFQEEYHKKRIKTRENTPKEVTKDFFNTKPKKEESFEDIFNRFADRYNSRRKYHLGNPNVFFTVTTEKYKN